MQAATLNIEPSSVVLHKIQPSDAIIFADLLRYRSGQVDGVAEAYQPLANEMIAMTENATSGCAIWLMIENDQAVGAITIMPTFHMHCRQLSYWLKPEFQGKGIATAALAQTIKQCFARNDIARLQAQVLPDNAASIRVLEKNEFTQEALLPKSDLHNGEPADAYLYGLVKGNN